MDSLTHALTGAVIAKAIDDKKLGNWGVVAGLAAGFFPDTDFVFGLFNRQYYLEYHRDFTHSILLLPFYALLLSSVFVKISKRPFFWNFFRICVPVLVSHLLLDLFTSYGTMVFSPFSERRYALDLLFIVDFIFSGILFIPWLVGMFWKRKARWLCRSALMALGFYVLFCGLEHDRATQLAKQFARGLKEEVIRVASLPQPLSPLRWANYVETKDYVYQGFLDLGRRGASSFAKDPREVQFDPLSFWERVKRVSGLYQSPETIEYFAYSKWNGSPWVERALGTEGVKFYYWFARFPVVWGVRSDNGAHRVEFMDLRFFMPGIRLPLLYHVEFDESGSIRSEGFERDEKKAERRGGGKG